ncbi:glyoxalase 2-1 [Striga asiatica]|uniref:Glyoxalase 2-1 n=1 Tax=Striga asiatica TaxID=4170 RepID=A0A5A7QU99_STRAF|nr:glyoxalase 2-1 [Striga asiatica]
MMALSTSSFINSSPMPKASRFSTSRIIMKPNSINVRASRLVDENMIVLRKRIHETIMRTSEGPPSEWMDWEKELYAGYDSMICDVVGHLQSFLMDTRPGVALGMATLIALSLPISTLLLVYNLLMLIKGCL